MNDAANLNGIPKRIKTIKMGGKEYESYPTDLVDHGLMQKWLDDRLCDRILNFIERAYERGKLPVDMLKFLELSAERVAAKERILIGTPEGEKELFETPEGMIFMSWLSVRHGQPNLTLEEWTEIARNDQRETLMRVIAAADPLVATDPKSTAPPANGSPSRRRRSTSRSTGGLSITDT